MDNLGVLLGVPYHPGPRGREDALAALQPNLRVADGRIYGGPPDVPTGLPTMYAIMSMSVYALLVYVVAFMISLLDPQIREEGVAGRQDNQMDFATKTRLPMDTPVTGRMW